MKHLSLIAVLAIVAAVTTGGNYSAGPAMADCTWRTNGRIWIEPDGSKMQCHCEFVPAVDEYWCSAVLLEARAKPSKYRIKHKFRGARYYGHPRVGVWVA